jgi:release factor glutamine methyltransferase
VTARSVGQAWRAARDRLAAAGIESAARDAKLLAGMAFGLDTLALALQENSEVGPEQQDILLALVERRLAHEPVARILGEKEFYGLAFGLNAATLVPRPETEQLVDLGLQALAGHKGPVFLDLGTGSGCIAIALLVHLPDARAMAVDINTDALVQARLNAERHGVADRIAFIEGSWFAPLARDTRFDLIVSNPPYIPRAEIGGLDADVRDQDPRAALDGGVDGLDAYRLIAAESGDRLAPQGAVVVEHGAGQGEAVGRLFGAAGFTEVAGHRDLAGLDRVVLARR